MLLAKKGVYRKNDLESLLKNCFLDSRTITEYEGIHYILNSAIYHGTKVSKYIMKRFNNLKIAGV